MKLVMRYPGFLKKALTLSYDDGVETDIKLIEILNKYSLKATFNLNSSLMGGSGMYVRRLSYNECKNLYLKNGMEVASHTLHHLDLTNLSANEVVREIIDDKKALEEMTGRDVVGFAYPFGTYDKRIIKTLRESGFIYARTTETYHDFRIPKDFLAMGATCRHKDPLLLDLAHKFINDDNIEPYLFTLWGHSYEFYHDDNFHLIEEFASIVGNKDFIWYATNKEVVEYINAYNSLIIDDNAITNLSNLDVFVSIDNQNYLIGKKETLYLKKE